MASFPAYDIEAQPPSPPPPPPSGRPAQRGGLRRLEENDRSSEGTVRCRSLMVVAAVIAGFAFIAGLKPSGGVLREPYNNGGQYIMPGKAVLAITNRWLYEMYYLCVTVAFACSFTVIGCVMNGLPVRRRIFIIVLRVMTSVSMMAILLAHCISIAAFTALNVHSN